MENKENREVPPVLASLNLEFSHACSAGKRIIYAGILDDKLLLADFLRHTRVCVQCAVVVDSSMPKLGMKDLASLMKGIIS